MGAVYYRLLDDGRVLGERQPPTAASQLAALRPAVRVHPRARRCERTVEPPEPAAAGASQLPKLEDVSKRTPPILTGPPQRFLRGTL